MKLSQKQWVIKALKEHGYITRNSCLARHITRLSAIIQVLEEEHWQFEAFEHKKDYVYKVIQSRFKKVEYFIPKLNQKIESHE